MKANAPKTGQRLLQRRLEAAANVASLLGPARGALRQTSHQGRGSAQCLAQQPARADVTEHRRPRRRRPLSLIREVRTHRSSGTLKAVPHQEASDWPTANIKVVDIAGLRHTSSEATQLRDPDELLPGTHRAAVEAARAAAEKEGFFQVVGHGVSEELLRRVSCCRTLLACAIALPQTRRTEPARPK